MTQWNRRTLDVIVEKPRLAKDVEQPSKWVKIDLADNFKDEMGSPKEDTESGQGLFRKRGGKVSATLVRTLSHSLRLSFAVAEKSAKRTESKGDSDSDLDSIPRRRSDPDGGKAGLNYDEDGDISPGREQVHLEDFGSNGHSGTLSF